MSKLSASKLLAYFGIVYAMRSAIDKSVDADLYDHEMRPKKAKGRDTIEMLAKWNQSNAPQRAYTRAVSEANTLGLAALLAPKLEAMHFVHREYIHAAYAEYTGEGNRG